MSRAFNDRLLLIVSVVLVVLLGVLAVLQYRWSGRVAAADAQREREHLQSSATLFATKFNTIAARAIEFLQNEAWNAHQTGAAVTNVPRIIGELYYVELGKEAHVERLSDNGLFVKTEPPTWLPKQCAPFPLNNPPALVAPIYNVEISSGPAPAAKNMQIFQAISREPVRCFVARMNENFLRNELVPDLVHQSFGDTSVKDYDFAITTRGSNPVVVYGTKLKADVAKAFFSTVPLRLGPPDAGAAPGLKNRIFVQRFESTVVVRAHGAPSDLLSDGIWELDVARKGAPLEVAFERTRWRNLALGVAVGALLVVAIMFLTVTVRREQRLAEQKMQFVAAVSHELRTPVSSISMLSKNQADGLVTETDRVRQYGELIHNESRRLSDMVEQTLKYAGMHSGLRRKQNSRVDVRSIVRNAVAARRTEFERRNIDVEVSLADDLPQVAGDANLLRTAIDNLLNNAERHAGDGRWIRVSAIRSTKEIIVSVEDRGPGIDPEDQAEIFEPFSRGSAAIAAQIPGSGLGLSLVRSAAEAHNGTVTLESAPGRGSTFKVHLPI